MPSKPPVFKPQGYSEKHREEDRTQWKQSYEAARPSSTQRGYNGRWRKARIGFLKKHPLCTLCLAQGITKAANVVDHITPHKGDKTLFWERNNWQPLCKPCHDSKTAGEDGGFGNREGRV